MEKLFLTNEDITIRVAEMAVTFPQYKAIYGIPRGGLAPAYYLAAATNGTVVDDPAKADFFIDDLEDTGATRRRYEAAFPRAPFIVLYDHSDKPKQEWLVFPWEVTDQGNDESATDIFVRLLEYIGEDPTREGLEETPQRMAKMWKQVTKGYDEAPAEYFKVFKENAGSYDEMIVLSPIPFYSHCEHHLLPFFGQAFIGYIPGNKFAGISKFARVVETFSTRLQIQERMTHQIADVVNDLLEPRGVGVIIKARHLCMEMRGVNKPGVFTTTSAMKGLFLKEPKVKSEFLELIKLEVS